MFNVRTSWPPLIGGLLTIAFAVSTPSQVQQEAPIRADSTLMEVEVRALDRQSRPIEGLTAADFRVFENGEPQPIRVFEYIDVPRRTARQAAEGASEEVAGQPESEFGSGTEPLRILISTQIGEAERLRTRDAIRKFIDKELPTGALVSLNGAPFVSDPELLLEMLELDPLIDAMTGNPVNDQRFQMPLEPSPAEELTPYDLLRGRRFRDDRQPTDHLFEQLGRSQLNRYIDMIRALRPYPGKKLIVLFARGFSMGFDSFQEVFVNLQNNDLLEGLKAESTRARISLYIVDARGLESGPGVSAGDSDGQRPEALYSRRQGDAGVPGFLLNASPVGSALDDGFRQRQNGLQVIAEQTGGVAVLNTNNLGEVFDKVRQDLGGYYVLGYYLPERENPKTVRKVRVELSEVKARLRYREEFYDDAAFTALLEQEYRDRLTEALGPLPGKSSKNAPAAALEAYRAAHEQLGSPEPRYAEAARRLEQAVELYPGFAAAWNLLGYARERLGDADAAVEAYAAAVEAEPGYLRPSAHLARLALGRQDGVAAAEHAGRLLAAEPADPEAAYFLATAHYGAGDMEAASEAAEHAMTSGAAAKFPSLFQLQGLILAGRGDFVAATESYRRYLTDNPDAPDAALIEQQIRYWETAPDLLALREEIADEAWPSALDRAQALLEIDPELSEARYYVALAAFRLGEHDLAVEAGEALIEAGAGDDFPPLYRLLGAVHAERGEIELASRQYRGFLALHPDSPEAADLERQLSEWEKALRYEQRGSPGLRIVNRFGGLTVRAEPGAETAMSASALTRDLLTGDVVVVEEDGRTTIEVRPADGARIDLELTVPYGQSVEAVTADGPVALAGLFYDARVETISGAIRLAAPWRAMRLDMEAHTAPGALTLPPGELLAAEQTAGVWTLTDRHPAFVNTYGRIAVRASSPAEAVVSDAEIPEASPIKMPWQAEDVFDSRPRGPSTEPTATDSDSDATFSADVRLVSLNVSVTGADGMAVLDLGPEDFEVLEDGRPQKIESISAGSAPFNLAILLDFSGSTLEDRGAIKLAARRLIGTARPIDRVALYTLGNEMFAVASELTSEYRRLVP